MKNLRCIKKTFFEILQILAQDEKLQRLLILDSNDPLTETNFNIMPINELLANRYICIAPVENGIEEPGRNSFLILQFHDITFENYDGNLEIGGSIFIGCPNDKILLQGNKSRLFEIIDRIIKILDEKKLSSAGKISFTSAKTVTYSEYTYGYRLSFVFVDQSSGKAEL